MKRLKPTGTQGDSIKFTFLAIMLTIGIFIIDLFTPLGVADGILYVIIVLLTMRIEGKQVTWLSGIVSTVLTLLGYFLSPPHESIWIVVTNRCFALVGIWIGVYVTFINKQSRATILKAKERMDALFEFATEGIMITGQRGNILLVNPMAEKMFGYEKGELAGKKIETLVPARFQTRHIQYRDEYYHHPRARAMGKGMDLYGMKKDGSEFPVEISLSHYTTQEGLFVVAFIIDITERKIQTDAIRFANERLKEYTQKLKSSNEELENFAYISSHDLQEPLRKIQSFGDRIKTLESEKFSEQGKDYLERILNAATRMQTLINDLLAFSRLTTRAQPFAKVDLNKILQEVLSDLEISIQKANAKIEVSSLPVIDAEPTQMRQLLQNLVANAIKFRREHESPVVKIYSKPNEKKPNESVDIFIEDNGIGFDEKYLDRIFNIFQRLDGSKYEGSGIGLAVCKKIAVRHGGNITAKSQAGKGSTFMVTLAVKQTAS